MTQTCATCYDRDCPQVGSDMHKCEHYVRLSDVDPQPVVETPLKSELRLEFASWHEIDAIKARLRNVEQTLHDIGRAVRGELP